MILLGLFFSVSFMVLQLMEWKTAHEKFPFILFFIKKFSYLKIIFEKAQYSVKKIKQYEENEIPSMIQIPFKIGSYHSSRTFKDMWIF